MSAFICNPAHVRELAVYAANPGGPPRVHPASVARYVGESYPTPINGEEVMVPLRNCEDDQDLARAYAAILWGQNVRSVMERYPGEPARDLPGPAPLPDGVEITAHEYFNPRVTDPVAILKMAGCLEYQSCETDDWRETGACFILECITASAIRSLPGFDSAPYEFVDTDENKPKTTPIPEVEFFDPRTGQRVKSCAGLTFTAWNPKGGWELMDE